MKTCRNILVFVTALQLAIALPMPNSATELSTTTTVGPLTMADKRYNFINYIATLVNQRNRDQLFDMINKHESVQLDYSEWMLTHKDSEDYNPETYQSLKDDIEQVLRDAGMLKKDKDNCELQRKLQDEYFAVEIKRVRLKNKELNQIWKQHGNHSETTISRFNKSMASLASFLEEIGNVIEDFLRGISESDKEKNKTLINGCQQFLNAKGHTAQLIAFSEFGTLMKEEYITELNAGNYNCIMLSELEYNDLILSLMFSVFGPFELI